MSTEIARQSLVDVDLDLTAEEGTCSGAWDECPKAPVRGVRAMPCGDEKFYCWTCFEQVWKTVHDWLRQYPSVQCKICQSAITGLKEVPLR